MPDDAPGLGEVSVSCRFSAAGHTMEPVPLEAGTSARVSASSVAVAAGSFRTATATASTAAITSVLAATGADVLDVLVLSAAAFVLGLALLLLRRRRC